MRGVPAEKLLSETARGVVVARPGREAWAAEEIGDALALLGREYSVERLVKDVLEFRANASVSEVASALYRFEYSFIRYIVVSGRCLPCGDPLLEELRREAESAGGGEYVLRYKPRGACSIARRDVEQALKAGGLRLSRRASRCVAIEAVREGCMLVSFSRIKRWSYDCRVCVDGMV